MTITLFVLGMALCLSSLAGLIVSGHTTVQSLSTAGTHSRHYVGFASSLACVLMLFPAVAQFSSALVFAKITGSTELPTATMLLANNGMYLIPLFFIGFIAAWDSPHNSQRGIKAIVPALSLGLMIIMIIWA